MLNGSDIFGGNHDIIECHFDAMSLGLLRVNVKPQGIDVQFRHGAPAKTFKWSASLWNLEAFRSIFLVRPSNAFPSFAWRELVVNPESLGKILTKMTDEFSINP